MKDSGIGRFCWKIYADSTLNQTVSGKEYARATGGHLQVTVASDTIMTYMVFITAITSFLTAVESSDIHNAMKTTAPYFEVPKMPVSTSATDQSAWRSTMRKKRK